jgi:hypothetical protein
MAKLKSKKRKKIFVLGRKKFCRIDSKFQIVRYIKIYQSILQWTWIWNCLKKKKIFISKKWRRKFPNERKNATQIFSHRKNPRHKLRGKSKISNRLRTQNRSENLPGKRLIIIAWKIVSSFSHVLFVAIRPGEA